MTSETDALRLAISHIEHMAAWIGSTNRGEAKGLYSFEALGEDMPGIRDALSQTLAPAAEPAAYLATDYRGLVWVVSAPETIALARNAGFELQQFNVSQQTAVISREELIEIVMRETTDLLTEDGLPTGRPNILIQGCKFVRGHARGYEKPVEAAHAFAGFIADAIRAKQIGHRA
ncbi:MAG: hypothetical protein V4514_19870 [Pseudomonadota bacterium]|uniref:hypothetical protein n=1 Tax=Phenylobacterium sp. TaxID=1871053 RepID=UPI0025E2CA62|nr:hypothetical protein [Phenylobacterium sp.]MBT9472103.1 hypothetical protein [Phenylobacterium sp.]